MRLADGLRPDLRDAEVDQVRGDEHARLDVGADRDDRDLEVGGADLPERVDRARIRLHGVRDTVCPLLHEVRIFIDREHLTVESLKLPGGRGAESAEAEHQNRGVVRDSLNQRWASLRRA